MTTYAAAKALGNATAVFWAEISGLHWNISDGVVTAAHFSDGYTNAQTFMACLAQVPDSFSRSIDVLPGRGTMGGFSLECADITTDTYPSGFLTWLFGGDRASINVARLTAGVDSDDTSWSVTPAQGPGVDIIGYCDLETIRYFVGEETPSTLSGVERAMYHSPAVPHRQSIANVYPTITDHPTRWAGRIVTLFQSYLLADGSLASSDGTTATARAEAHKWRAILRDVRFENNVWTLRCDSLDTLLKRQLVRGQARVPVQRRVYVAEAMVNQDVAADGIIAGVVQYDPATNTEYTYRCQIATGWYSRDSLVAAFNAAWDAATTADTDGNLTWKGTMALAFADEEVTLQYTETGVAGEERIVGISFDVPIYNVAANRPGTTMEYWDAIGTNPGPGHAGNVGLFILPDGDATPTLGETYSVSWPGSAATQVHIYADTRALQVAVGEDELGASVTSFTAGDAVAVVSQAGVSACEVIRLDGGNDVLYLRMLTAVQQAREITHTGTLAQPIEIRKAFFGYGGQVEGLAASALGHSTLQALLSSGTAGFNHDDYDTLNEGIGVDIPHMSPMAGVNATESLIDVEAFERFFAEAEAYQFTVVDFIYEPTTALDWLTSRLGFLGGHLLVRDGQFTVRRVEALNSSSDATLTEDELQGLGRIATGQIHSIDGVKYEHNWSVSERAFAITTEAVRGSLTASESENVVTYSDKGLRVPDPLELRWLGMDVLYQFDRENWVYELVSDRVHWDIEPGDVIRFSDEGAGDATDDTRRYHGLPHPEGTRGYENQRLLTLSVTTEASSGMTQIKAVNVRTRQSGYSPSAWIESFTNVGNAVLTCTSQFFSPAADGVDVSRFTVGDKVRILSVNPTQAGAEPGVETSEGGLTIQSINTTASTITLTGVLAVAWPGPLPVVPSAATQCMVLVHDPYQTASQTDAAKEWAHVGDSSGDIGDGGDLCYRW